MSAFMNLPRIKGCVDVPKTGSIEEKFCHWLRGREPAPGYRRLTRLRGAEEMDQPVHAGAEDPRGRNGQDPGPHDLSGHAPADGREAACGTHADDRAGDGVSGRYKDAEGRGREDGDGRSSLGRETSDRLQLRDLRAHRMNDAPSARQ